MSSHTSSLSLASTIIGFVSFAFTLATLARVFWSNFKTFASAPSEITDSLTFLKQTLHEERFHLRKIRTRKKRRRRSSSGQPEEKDAEFAVKERGPDPDQALRAMSTSIRHMITQFREIERHFVEGPMHHSNRRSRDDLGEDGYGRGYDSSGPDDFGHDSYTTHYRKCGLRERYIWLTKKHAVHSLLEKVHRIELRRMAMQMVVLSVFIKDMNRQMQDFDDRLDGLDRVENRLSRVVGVRRIQ